MRTGTVTNNTLYGTITPDDGGVEVYFNPPAVRPTGYWPSVDQAVEFDCYIDHDDWAKLVRDRT